MASTTGIGGPELAIFEIAIGEALFASTLATIMLTNQVASGRLSHHAAEGLLDGATLVLESNRGANADNAASIDYALNRLSAVGALLQQLRNAASPDLRQRADQQTPAFDIAKHSV